MDVLIEFYEQIPVWVQLLLLLVASTVAIAAHVAPYTKNVYDDRIAKVVDDYGLKAGIKVFLAKAFHVLAGNYRNAKNK